MQKLTELISPHSRQQLWVKSVLIVLLFACTDSFIAFMTGSLRVDRPLADFLFTFFLGMPFALVVLSIMVEQRQLQIKLAALAATDMLTGLANRRAFDEQLENIGKKDAAGVLLLVDADHFKSVNDSYGHTVGDQCLVAIADHLRSSVRESDIVSRMGGEEFAVFLPATSIGEGRRVADNICTPIEFTAPGVAGHVSITLSIGATRMISGQSLREALQIADAALYRAKEEGRNRTVWTTQPVPVSQTELFV